MVAQHLAERARLYRQIRDYFAAQDVLEVDLPVVGRSASLDPNLDSLVVRDADQAFFLQTSPEYFMKRLLAAGSGSIYSLTHGFRRGEQGRLHNPEFALLEWYRVGFSMQDLIADVKGLLDRVVPDQAFQQATYAELLETHLGIDPHRADTAALQRLVRERTSFVGDLPPSAALQLLFSQVVEPAMPPGIQVVTHYPEDQAALARLELNAQGARVGLRFECYLNGVELANGYEELTDAAEQRQRFAREQQQRAAAGLEVPAMDEQFLAALEQGVPACSGVALGLDRLLMLAVGADSLAAVLPFDWASL